MNLTLRNVAKMLNVSQRAICRRLEQENIPVYRVNEQYRFNRAELLAWATARRLKVSDQLFQEFETRGTPLPGLSETLAAGGISHRVDGRDLAFVPRATVALVRLPDEVGRQGVWEMLLARESPTAIGQRIAIPHVRYPIALHAPQPLRTLCFLEHPIDFGALGGRPVRILLLLPSPTIRGRAMASLNECLNLRGGRFRRRDRSGPSWN